LSFEVMVLLGRPAATGTFCPILRFTVRYAARVFCPGSRDLRATAQCEFKQHARKNCVKGLHLIFAN